MRRVGACVSSRHTCCPDARAVPPALETIFTLCLVSYRDVSYHHVVDFSSVDETILRKRTKNSIASMKLG
jgi:hypothetical protein